MQIVIKLKGFLKIALFFGILAASVGYTAYRAYLYVSYRRIVNASHLKRIKNFERKPFEYAMPIKDSGNKGYLLLAPYVRFNLKYGRLIVMDTKGNMIVNKAMNGAVVDFRQWVINRHKWYSYGVDDSSAKHVTLSAGHIVILDSVLNEVKQVHLLPYGGITVNDHEDLDLHDFIMLSENHFITMASYEKKASNIPANLFPAPETKVVATLIQEINNGVVTWQWDGSKFPEFYLNSEVGNEFYDTAETHDYTHINSMALDPRDSNLIVSLRQLNQVIKINRHTGDIIWRLGGRNSDFLLTVGQAFLRQHCAVLNGDTLLVFDNGEKTIRPYSRILEYKLNEQQKTIASFKAYNIPMPMTESLGSVQKVGNDYLICGGTARYVMLVNSITGEQKMKLTANQSFYRAYLVNDISGIKAEH